MLSVTGGIDQKLVRDLAWKMVEKTAPAERCTFRPVSEDYFATRKPPSGQGRDGSDPLGIGLAEITIVVTPAAVPCGGCSASAVPTATTTDSSS